MSPDTMVYALFAAYAGLFGLLFGSFMNVCIARMPADRSIVFPGSACPKCGTAIKPYDNVPVLAWLWLGGRCRACKAPISARYPAVEAAFGVLAVLLFRHLVPDLADVDAGHLVAFVWYGWLAFCLMALTFIDLEHQIIPDPFSIYSVPVGVLGALALPALGYHDTITWQQSVVGAMVGGLGLWAMAAAASWWYGLEAMGTGDAKLMALIGSYFGAVPALVFILVLGSVVGSVVGVTVAVVRRRSLKLAMPFGPFLALGALVWLFFGDEVRVTFLPWAFWG